MSAVRPMRRARQALAEDEIREVLRTVRRGVLAVIGDGGRPYCVTLNPLYDEETDRLYFHGAKEGHKIDALRRDPRACFTAIDEGTHAPPVRPTGRSPSAASSSTDASSSWTTTKPPSTSAVASAAVFRWTKRPSKRKSASPDPPSASSSSSRNTSPASVSTRRNCP